MLDEPTNDLDIPTLNALEDFLTDLNICLLIVSHDRFFMDKLCTKLLVFEGERRDQGMGGQLHRAARLTRRNSPPAPPKRWKPR
jgi:ATPase subunit of ABC transporter with duplicated ATPase domains